MSFPVDQVEELKAIFSNVSSAEEGGVTFFFIPSLELPPGCRPEQVDALLCPTLRDGYHSRLFYAAQVQSPTQRNWNASGVRILERTWYAFSWKVPENLRLAQMISIHLRGLR